MILTEINSEKVSKSILSHFNVIFTILDIIIIDIVILTTYICMYLHSRSPQLNEVPPKTIIAQNFTRYFQ